MMKALSVAAIAAIGWCTAASAQSVGGKYDVNGTNFDGSPYKGTAVITRSSDSTCRIHWQTGSTSDGICMLANKSFAAAYQMGKDVGLVLYDLWPDGSLKGYWTIADEPGSGTEILTPAR